LTWVSRGVEESFGGAVDRVPELDLLGTFELGLTAPSRSASSVRSLAASVVIRMVIQVNQGVVAAVKM
jgi:hypothetical protein